MLQHKPLPANTIIGRVPRDIEAKIQQTHEGIVIRLDSLSDPAFWQEINIQKLQSFVDKNVKAESEEEGESKSEDLELADAIFASVLRGDAAAVKRALD